MAGEEYESGGRRPRIDGMMECPECDGKAEIIEWNGKTTVECMKCDFREDRSMTR